MLLVPSAGWKVNAAAFYANATEYNGTTSYLSKASTIYGSSSSVGSAVVWGRLDADTEAAGTYSILSGQTSGGFVFGLSVDTDPTPVLNFGAIDSDFNPVVLASSTSLGSLPTLWLALMMSWDMNAGAGSRSVQMYSGDNSIFNAFDADIGSAFSIPLSSLDNWAVGSNGSGGGLFNGGMAGLWVDFTTKIDFSNVTNRRKFFSAAGKPVDLGADGSIPLGTTPALYLKNAAASVETNSGSGGNFTRNGTLVAAATSPSDDASPGTTGTPMGLLLSLTQG